ncbi:MAG: helix-turn-helix transcriptional regulator [Bryobacterales bacterium]|nr:helix-turn-helix transcriptional regulator [Bryobacterales bacterium]
MIHVSTLKKQFGERLRSIRLQRRVTQDEFAEFLGVSSDFISNIERGINAPSFDVLEAIAARLGMTVSDLFNFSEEPGTRRRVKLPRRRRTAEKGSGRR